MDEEYAKALVAVFLEDSYRLQRMAPHIPMRQIVKWQIFNGIGIPICAAFAYFLLGEGDYETLDPDLLARAASYIGVPAEEYWAESFRRAREGSSERPLPAVLIPDDNEPMNPYQEIMFNAFRRTFPET
jgi:hypothetical protein